MIENGFDTAAPSEAQQQAANLEQHPPAVVATPEIRDLRHLAWSSIDNDTSRDLDQLEVAKRQPDGAINVQVAIADVDAFVRASVADRSDWRRGKPPPSTPGSATFPCCRNSCRRRPRRSRRAPTSGGRHRLVVAATGHVQASAVYRAIVRNTAQLTYGAVGAWLEERAPCAGQGGRIGRASRTAAVAGPGGAGAQDERHRHGALNIETIETRPVLLNDQVTSLEQQEKNRATELIEDFMIASNEIVARLLATIVPSIRRVVKTPKRWDRIVAVAAAARRAAAGGSRLEGAQRIPGGAKGRRSRPLRGFVAGRHQTDGARGVRG